MNDAVRNDHEFVKEFEAGAREKQGSDSILLALYGEICNNWRMLTEIRFKLLGFLPTVSVVALIGVLSRSDAESRLSSTAHVAVCVFGLLITLGLWVYDWRNNELYRSLMGQARRIEQVFGTDFGQFMDRKAPGNDLINHSNAVNLIYLTVIAGWLFALLAAALGWL